MPAITIAKAFLGLNNTIDPARLPLDLETGIIDLAESVNVKFDKTGRPSTRKGSSLLYGGSFHSIFTRGSIGYVGMDDRIYRINPDLTLTGVRDELLGGWISYVWTPLGVFYSNRMERGILNEDRSDLWQMTPRVRNEATRHYTGPPEGISHLELFSSMLFAAVGDTLWRSRPNDFGLFRKGVEYNLFPSRIRMVRAVAGGMYVSDDHKTYFLSGEPKDFNRKVVMESPAMEWSDGTDLVEPHLLGLEGDMPYATWVSQDGLTYGSPIGQVIVPTKSKIVLPTGFSAGALVRMGRNFVYNLHQ